MIGTMVGNFEIVEKIGEGGMGVVYKARDSRLNRDVALKFLPDRVNESEPDRQRFLQEAQAAAGLNHPNICTIHGVEEAEGRIFIIMEYVDGETIRKRVPFAKVDDAVGLAICIGEALQEAHGKGIVHRDIKADNIMLTAKGQVKVMDFGLAKVRGSMKLTRTSSTAGTLGYMAPEQIQGGEVDSRSDIFSFGVLLFEMFSGKTPFRGDHEAAMVYSIVNEEPEAITTYLPDISASLVNILEKALEKNPDDRYQSVGEMVVDLRRSRKDSTKVSRILPGVPVSAGPAPQGRPAVSSGRKRHPAALAGVTLVVLAVAAYFGVRLLSPADEGASFPHLKISRLTSDGKAVDIAISPDGKYIAYVHAEKEKYSLFLRQVSTTGTVAISPPTENALWGLTFSPSGDFLYYLYATKGTMKTELFQVPVLGGSPKTIKQHVRSRIAFTPDGSQILFLRDSAQVTTQLVRAELKGDDEAVLARRHSPEHFDDLSLSPDGKFIALIEGKSGSYLNHRVVVHSLSDGEESILPNQSWLTLTGFDWMGDGTGIMLTAADQQSSFDSPQIWILPFPKGTPRRITNDLSSYFVVRPGSRSNLFAALQSESNSNLFVVQRNLAVSAKPLTRGTRNQTGMKGLRWLRDGRVLYTSRTDGYDNLWIAGKDGEGARQITSGSFTDMDPVLSPGDQSIVFVSNRAGVFNLWHCELDGSNLRQLTHGNYEVKPDITPDGRWILYGSYGDNSISLWKTSLSGDSTQLIVRQQILWGCLSPDGTRYAYGYFDGEQKQKLAVIELATQQILHEIEFSHWAVRWTADGTSVAYLDTREDVSNIWSQDINGGEPKQLTDFADGVIFAFDWTADGKQLIVSRGESSTDVVLFTDSDFPSR
jgi:eukaryotic-like serine/threonine-protein kinase